MIRAEFKAYGSYTTDSVYQWDLNQELNITGLDVSTAPVIAFECNGMSESIVVQSKLYLGVITCAIPNAILQFGKDIVAHLCEEDRGQYKAYEKMIIPVIKRKKPSDYLFSDNVPIITYESLLAELAKEKNRMGYVTIKDANEFMYDEEMLESKLGNFTYTKRQIDEKVGAIKLTNTTVKTAGAGVTLESGAVHSLVAINLTPGTYMIVGRVYFLSVPSGIGTYRRIKFSNEPASVTQSLTFYDNMSPIANMGEICQFTDFLEVKETTKYYLCAQHDASSSLTVHGQVDAIRLR